jgi:hypothetical protein
MQNPTVSYSVHEFIVLQDEQFDFTSKTAIAYF